MRLQGSWTVDGVKVDGGEAERWRKLEKMKLRFGVELSECVVSMTLNSRH